MSKRESSIKVSLTPDELNLFKQTAQAAGRSLAGLIRYLLNQETERRAIEVPTRSER